MAKYRLKRNDPHESICRYCRDKAEDMPADVPLSKRDLWVLERIALYFEKSKLNSYVEMLGKPRRWFLLNIWGGIGRGIGMAIGFTVLGAALFLILQQLVMLNLPIISEFIAEILDLVEGFRSVSP